MGDDDVPLGGAIEAVLECLERDQPDLLYLPAKWIEGNLTEQASNKIQSKEAMILDSMSLTVRSSVYVTFISSWVMNKDAYLSRADTRIDRYRDTLLPQLEWIFSLLAEGQKIICANGNWVIARGGSSGGYSVFEPFSVQYNRIVDEKLADKPQLHRFFRHCMLWCFIPGLVWGVRKNTMGSFGEFDKEKVMSVLKSAYGNDIFFMLIIVPMIKLNEPLAWCFRLAARVLAKSWVYFWRIRSAIVSRANV
jgi:hypothetical protein